LAYVHLQTSTSAEETVAGKLAFERFAKSNGVATIKHYHADNGIFADNLFRRAVSEGGQTLTFCGASDPRVEHAKAIRWIDRYLKGTRDQGIILHPSEHSFDCYAEADFAGNWNPSAINDPATAKSRSGFLIKYAGCPVFWASKM
jgi:hypothetical protein